MPRGLHGVGVEKHAFFTAQRADFRNRLNGADLVVGEHHRHKAGVVSQCACNVAGRYHAAGVNVEKSDVIALFLKAFERVEYGVMLECGGDNVLFALFCTKSGG